MKNDINIGDILYCKHIYGHWEVMDITNIPVPYGYIDYDYSWQVHLKQLHTNSGHIFYGYYIKENFKKLSDKKDLEFLKILYK